MPPATAVPAGPGRHFPDAWRPPARWRPEEALRQAASPPATPRLNPTCLACLRNSASSSEGSVAPIARRSASNPFCGRRGPASWPRRPSPPHRPAVTSYSSRFVATLRDPRSTSSCRPSGAHDRQAQVQIRDRSGERPVTIERAVNGKGRSRPPYADLRTRQIMTRRRTPWLIPTANRGISSSRDGQIQIRADARRASERRAGSTRRPRRAP
jgi:hypothetical protein